LWLLRIPDLDVLAVELKQALGFRLLSTKFLRLLLHFSGHKAVILKNALLAALLRQGGF